ncbi:MAG: formylglycine-generating enzyme family protein [Chitinivibrionia bacterium]|nr:formylglycine-generating enzyme family protein [Chitinivibrionia bacterium]
MSKKIFELFAILTFAAIFCVGCGGKIGGDHPSELLGSWMFGNGVNYILEMELLKDGRGVVDGDSITWKVEDAKLIISSIISDFDYTVFGAELTLEDQSQEKAILVKKERWKDYKSKQIEALLSQYFVPITGATYMMGCTPEQGESCYDNEKPAHSVTIGDFQIGRHLVTQKLWKAVTGNSPSGFKGDDLPVESVSWDDVQEFLSTLNSITGKNYRLPTEAEWEFAARGGNKSKGYKFSGSNNLGELGWSSDNSGGKTQTVGQKKPNELDIYDMSGNVFEWCSDWYGPYPSGAAQNPQGPSSGEYRIMRGGSWRGGAKPCRVSNRHSHSPSFFINVVGFRLAAGK